MPKQGRQRTRQRNNGLLGEVVPRPRSHSPMHGNTGRTLNSSGSTRPPRYDMENPANWTLEQLRTEILLQGYEAPPTFKKSALIQLFEHNRKKRRQLSATITSSSGIGMPGSEALQINDNIATDLSTHDNGGHVTSGSHPVQTSSDHVTMSNMAAAIASLTKTVDSLANKVNRVCSPCTSEDNATSGQETPFHTSLMSIEGVPSQSLPHVETVPDHIRQQILTGKDVNLASLLLPNIDNSSVRAIQSNGLEVHFQNTDPRLSRSLTLGEFLTAFSKYRTIMCEVYPNRSKELNEYEREIISIAMKFGGSVFYDYHRAFSARAAAMYTQHKIRINWGIRDNYIFSNVTAGRKVITCNYCNSLDHFSPQCPSNLFKKDQDMHQSHRDRHSDKRGRPRLYHQGKEICNNFNSETGCKHEKCTHMHVCLSCKKEHPKIQCGK